MKHSNRINGYLSKRREKGANLFEVIRKLNRKLILSKKSPDLNSLARQVHSNAIKKGFWPASGRSDGECIALMHSELSEALEALRKPMIPKYPYAWVIKIERNKPPKPVGIAEELADTIIRILDFCGARHIDIDRAVKMKILYNKTRPFRHGKKF